jgi:S-adenosylmethionine:tRNA ribosyltransferase-isomerase
MRLEEFNYDLDPELIAQHPCDRRDQSRLMVVDRVTGKYESRYFYQLPEFLRKGDVLVVNDSKVIPARLYARKPTGGLVEILLVSDRHSMGWEAMVRPAKRVRVGMSLLFEDGSEVEVLEKISDKKWLLRFRTETPFEEFLNRYGKPPLPPYIKREQSEINPEDRQRYQTIYARMPGSIAAPTAGLHFSHQVMSDLDNAGIRRVSVTLHVGFGTFLPIEAENIEEHRMEKEYFEIGEEAAEAINSASRVIAVGTTATRTLESAADEHGHIKAASGYTNLYAYPGYRFKRVNSLITNFHLPKSSLLLLVSAFAGKETIREAYAKAMKERYRFYSYGDCMLIM